LLMNSAHPEFHRFLPSLTWPKPLVLSWFCFG
jgi:hypothetical protein